MWACQVASAATARCLWEGGRLRPIGRGIPSRGPVGIGIGTNETNRRRVLTRFVRVCVRADYLALYQ